MQFRKFYATMALALASCGAPAAVQPTYMPAQPQATATQRAQPSPAPYRGATRPWFAFGVDCSHIPPANRIAYVKQRVEVLSSEERSRMPALQSIEWTLDADGGVVLLLRLDPPQPPDVAEPYGIDLTRRMKNDFCPRPA